jgi:hypothetical protein
MTLGLHDLDGGKSIFRALKISPFLGPKKSQFSDTTPSNGPCKGFARIELITSRRINGTTTKRQVSKRLKRQVYKTSGLQNIRFTIRQVFKTSGCKKHPYIFCTCGWW